MFERRSLVWVACALFWGCGGASAGSGPTLTQREEDPSTRPWNLGWCPPSASSGIDLRLAGTSGTTQYLIGGFHRYRLDAHGVRTASSVTTNTLIEARKLGSEDGPAAWYFVTTSGALLTSGDDFLGPLQAIATLPQRPARLHVPSSGAIALQLGDGSAIWTYGPEGARAIASPRGRIMSAAVRWPDQIAMFVEPGVVVLSNDGGETFHDVALDGRMPATLGADDDHVWIVWPDETASEIRSDGALAPFDAPGTAAPSMPTDPWCNDHWPLGLSASWPASEPTTGFPGATAGEHCVTHIGEMFVVSLCGESSDQRGPQTIRRFDPETRAFVDVASLPDVDPNDAQVIDSAGSATFVLLYPDSANANHTVFFDGHTLTPVTIDVGLSGVQGELAIAAQNDATDPPTLWHMPSATPVDLALPTEAGVLTDLRFAADGSLIATTRGADDSAALWLGTPGAWSARTIPDETEAVAMADAANGVARTRDGAFVTRDGARTWDAVEVDDDPRYQLTSSAHCSALGCVVGGQITFRPQDEVVAAEEVDTTTGLDAEPFWMYSMTTHWRCNPPSHTTLERNPEITYLAWGWVDGTEPGAAGAEIRWSGVDPAGAYHMHAHALAGTEWVASVAMTRRFAVGLAAQGIAIVSAQPHTIDLHALAPSVSHLLLTGDAETAVWDDGSVLMAITSGRAESDVRYELLVQLDPSGALVASRTFAWRGDTGRMWGLAAGPSGLVGRAVATADEAVWEIHPIDGSPPSRLEATLDPVAVCTNARPWTLVIGPSGPVEMAWGTTGWPATNVLRVSDDAACVSAVLPGQLVWGADETHALPFAFAIRGRIRGTALDRSPHGIAMTCSQE